MIGLKFALLAMSGGSLLAAILIGIVDRSDDRSWVAGLTFAAAGFAFATIAGSLP